MKTRIIAGLFVLAALNGSCRTREVPVSTFNGFTQGTTYSIAFLNSGRFDPAIIRTEVEKIYHAIDMSVSLYQDSSVLTRLNRNEDVVLDSCFTENFNLSRKLSLITGGAFDVTVGPLVRAWGFGPDTTKNVSAHEIDSLLKLVGMDKVEIRNGKLIKSDPRISLDFNAIAQGYTVDVICKYFDSLGIKDYLVEIGGEVRVRGEKNGVMWRIGIDRPVDNNMVPGADLQAVIRLKDKALATSGNYRKFYIKDGIKYSHTIDPKTGYPANNQLLSATIIAKDCATADGIATACMVMGKDKTIEFLVRYPEYGAFLIYSDDKGNFRTWSSTGLAEFISESGQ